MGEPNRTIYLLDVSYFIFRAYHALPPLTTAAGLPTNAVQGVATMIERLLRGEKSVYVAGCFDTPTPTFRRELYAEYKANRDAPEEDLQVQFPLVRRLVEALGIRCLDVPGYEADDLLATLAKRFSEAGREVVIVTGDKDLMQCVGERVSLFDAAKGKRSSHDEVIEKFGVPPAAVADVLGLMGDSSDNIPGVRGIGPKSATALIAHFGSMDAMYERTAEIEELSLRGAASVRRKIEEGKEMALLCRKLATVDYEVPLDLELKDLEIDCLATDELHKLADELEMSRIVSRMEGLGRDMGMKGASKEDALARELAHKSSGQGPGKGQMSLEIGSGGARGAADGDTATAGTPSSESSAPHAFDGVKVVDDLGALGDGPVSVSQAQSQDGEPLLALGSAGSVVVETGAAPIEKALCSLVGRGVSLVGFDLKDLRRERGEGPGPEGLDLGVASYLVDPSAGSHDKADVCSRHLGEAALGWNGDPRDAAAALDQVARLAILLQGLMDERGVADLYRSIEHPLISVLADLEADGILLDKDVLSELTVEFAGRMQELVEEIYAAAGCEFNVLSPLQLREVLFTRLELPTKGLKKTKTGPSTDSDSLAALAPLHPLPDLVLQYRGIAKLKSTYVDALPRLTDEAGRIHTRLNQTVAATGRLSSKDPNLQNIPIRTQDGARIRQAFIAGRGKRLISADYNQIELRVLAHLAQDEALISAFSSGVDVHIATAAEFFEVDLAEVTSDMRREAKVINYGIIYGMGPVRLSRELGIPRAKATEYIGRYFERYAGVKAFFEGTLEFARENGYVETIFHRRRYVPDIAGDHGGRRQMAERAATNTTIQGSAADVIKLAMIRLAGGLAERDLKSRLLLQIHDELLLESPVAEVDATSEVVVEVMEGAVELAVPLVVEVGHGRNWGEAH